MNSNYYSIIKLVTGEEIFCLAKSSSDSQDYLIIHCPIIFETHFVPQGMIVGAKRWLNVTKSDSFIINKNHIVVIDEMNTYSKNLYYETLTELEEKERDYEKEIEEINKLEEFREELEYLYSIS